MRRQLTTVHIQYLCDVCEEHLGGVLFNSDDDHWEAWSLGEWFPPEPAGALREFQFPSGDTLEVCVYCYHALCELTPERVPSEKGGGD